MHKGHARASGRKGGRLDSETIEAADAELLRSLDSTFETALERAGELLVCRPGCSDCCHRPFPITRLDALRLRRGWMRLREVDADAAERIRRRARGAMRTLEAGFPGDLEAGRLTQEEPPLDRFFTLHSGLPCPALDPETQTCGLYDSRPVACRTYGPPLRFGDEPAPHCELCFVGATNAQIERCRVEPDPGDLEGAILNALGVPGDEHWETLIAFALARD